MKKLFLFFLIMPLIGFGQNTFLESNINTNWINSTNELSFLESVDNNTYKSVTSNSFIFFIELDKDVYSSEDLNNERLLNCCMCSYTAIIQNSKDTLRIEKGSRDDFGNGQVVINTFYLEGDDLIQVKLINEEPSTLTIWSRVY
tara:strand:- start:73 stop:504 length:432 start_codon:yes stop_codon:yes gene_type:complete